jgi:RNA polymerase sigma-70 factor (ECF subfamily)
MIRSSSATSELVDVDDEVLMARFAAGRAEAFTELYDRYEAPLFGFCLRILGDAESAEDAFQDTMMAVIEQRFRYRACGRLRSWLFTIARNVCLDRARTGQRSTRLLTLYASPDQAVDVGPAQALESRDELTRLLATLTVDQREILLLHRSEGFSYAEIAEMTSSSEGSVKQKAHRALLALRSKRTR